MLTTTGPAILTALLACAAQSDAPARPIDPGDIEAPTDEQEDHVFCCTSVDHDKRTGEGCALINEETVNSCANVLYCPGYWTKTDGKVRCGKGGAE